MIDELIELEEEEYTSQLTGPIIRRIAGLMRPHWKWVVGFFITIALTSTTDAYFTYINKQFVDQGINLKNPAALTHLATIYGSIILFQAATVFIFVYLAGVLGERIQYDLRKMMFNHLQELSLSYYAQNAVGRLIARVTSDSGRVAELVTWGVVDITWSILNITTSLIFMMVINLRLGLIVSVIIPLMVLIAVQFRKKILVEFRKSRRANSKITGAYNENIQGVRVVKALGREDENLKEFQHLTGSMYRASYPRRLALGALPPHRADHRRAGPGRHRLVWRHSDPVGPHHHRRHQCLRLVPRLHDVARAGPGTRLCRDAAFGRLGRTDIQAHRHPAGGT